jgi:hypothetical protein
MHFTSFGIFLKYFRKENRCRTFCTWGQLDPGPLTGEPEAHKQTSLAGWLGRPRPWLATASDQGGRRSGARRGEGRGLAGPETHWELAGGVGLARGWPAATNLAAE